MAAAERDLARAKPDLQETIRAGVVQNFEVAYELCWKFMQRWLRENRGAQETDSLRTRKDVFRMAARFGLIPDPTPWFEFAEARNLTTLTDDAEQAVAAYETARRFLPHAEQLLQRLESKND